MDFPRIIDLPDTPIGSYFLWGPRQTGKSSLLKKRYADALYIDLLLSDQYLRFMGQPSLLRDAVRANPNRLVVIDEIQNIPLLLDEVHWLIENQRCVFVLCGSSARKIRRGHANLLGGRALRYELHGLVWKEIGSKFDLNKMINRGNLPMHYLSDKFEDLMDSYVGDYLKEEIVAEAVVRNIPQFIDFLRAAAITDTEIVDYTKIGSECGAKSATVRNHYQILVDTLLGFFLPAYTRKAKRRVIQSPKFYFSNVGIVNHLTKRYRISPGSETFGKAFENWMINEIHSWNSYSRKRVELSYWRLASGGEVDLILNDAEAAIEIKGSDKITTHHLKSLRELGEDYSSVKKRYLVCLEKTARTTEDGIEILPYPLFLERLWGGEIAG